MKEKPILFTPDNIRKIRSGEKTQTRRVVKPQPTFVENGKPFLEGHGQDGPGTRDRFLNCPYGNPGDRLWVREAWGAPETILGAINHLRINDGEPVVYKADGQPFPESYVGVVHTGWRSPMFMPKEFARTWLEVTAVRVERVQDITEEDAKAEGAELLPCTYIGECKSNSCPRHGRLDRYQLAYAALWDTINGKKHPWESNPWVFVIEFTLA